ncbi:type II toxin-antitoxin system RelE/ParE family toxin [Salipiger abyssi]|uniref:type II toxin-antitoxin system RelE/ParE family toxin n=1 Tax=Salipiger abyssi TaxID=1250539 RepID=UPI001A8C7574|nr:type II toxin-antitoxin system RelE/ParE family toxin [Salipiger abyssi]MBN9890565.1 type II toxin-antitoxin system RelE/ParE family toxin [Salipiger abyssi]
MLCIFRDEAIQNLKEIGDFIAQDSPERAVSYIQEMRAYCQQIALSPTIRRVVAHIEGRAVRKALFGNYHIYYTLLSDEDGIEIVHIRHGARRRPTF